MNTPSKTFCYHGRDSQGVKLFGGMLHAANWEDAAERATAGHGVKLRAGPGAHWVDKDGREVSLYLSVMPDQTKRGETLTREARKVREEENEKRAKEQEDTEQALSDAIEEAGGPEAALRKLRGE